MIKPIFTLATVLALVVAAAAQDAPAPADQPAPPPPKRHASKFAFGPEIGYFGVFSAHTRNRVGTGDTSIGFGIRPLTTPRQAGNLDLDFSFFSLKNGSSHAYVLPVGVKYRVRLDADDSDDRYTPYAGVGLDAVVAQIKSVPDNIDTHARVGAGANVFLGTLIGKKAFVEARLFGMTRIEGFNFSGAGIEAGYRF